jgi:hypothetical protein
MAVSNAKILSAILNKWAQPLIKTLLAGKVQSIGFLQNLESKVKSTGWVSPNWSLMQDLSPIMEGVTGSLITPMLSKYLSMVDDASIPKMAHDIVDEALKQGKLSIMEGKVELETEDLIELKNLLNYNLPMREEQTYKVITEEPKE